jgi:phage gpG-like protein
MKAMANKFVRVTRNDFPRLMKSMPKAVADGIESAAREGEGYVKQIISESPADGREYGNHTASSPGNPPRIDSGNLVNHINIRQESSYVWRIRSGAEYSADLEYGTDFMAARPYMGPMAFWLEQNINDIVGDYLKEAAE